MKLTITLLILLLMTVSVSAETHVFVGGGADFLAFNSEEGYKIDKDWGFSGGFMRSISTKWSAFTTYDYVVTKAETVDGVQSTLYERELLVSTGYLVSDTASKLQIRVLAGFEITDGNLPDYGMFLSFANGGIISYTFGDKLPKVWVAGTFNVSDNYYDGKIRLGLSYPVGDVLDKIL